SLSLHPHGAGQLGWLYEINSLSAAPLEAKLPAYPSWMSQKPGLEFRPLPTAPRAARRAPGRTRQFRELSQKFAGYESFRKDPQGKLERFELRLVPRPI